MLACRAPLTLLPAWSSAATQSCVGTAHVPPFLNASPCSALTSGMSLTLSPCKPSKKKDGDGVIEQIEKVPIVLVCTATCY